MLHVNGLKLNQPFWLGFYFQYDKQGEYHMPKNLVNTKKSSIVFNYFHLEIPVV